VPVEYTNREGKTSYLHVGKTKTGKPRYHFSMKRDGKLVDEIPEGYEIYEHPANGRVFLRKELPQLITDIEKHIVEKELKNADTSRRYLVDIKEKVMTIFESNQNIDRLKEIFGSKAPLNDPSNIDDLLNIAVDYSPIMRFVLEDEKNRAFIAERYCFLGSIDDWIYIGGPDPLKKIAKEYVKHLGQDSLFELY